MKLMKKFFSQTARPEGRLGKLILSTMNSGHAALADWGMKYLPETDAGQVIDLGCGGGRNAGELLKKYPSAHVTAVDHSELSVRKSREYNSESIRQGRCTVIQSDIAGLGLDDSCFDIATAFETVYFWDTERCFAEVYRILKDGGYFLICNESDGTDRTAGQFEKIIDGMKLHTAEDLAGRLYQAGFAEVKGWHHHKKPWIAVLARKGERP